MEAQTANEPDLSLVVPLYNEEDNVRTLIDSIDQALCRLGILYETVLVDDGSRDATRSVAAHVVADNPRVRLVVLRRNYGQTAAMSAGIRHARGRVIVTLDGDLQNDPADIPRLLALIDQGFDIVVGWRRRRQDAVARVVISRIANRIIAWLMGGGVRDSGCSLKAYRAELIQGLPLYGEMHRFIPALSQLAGARLAEIEVKHHPRRFGVSKYGYSRVIKVMLDIATIRMLLSYSRRPVLWHSTATALVAVLSGFALAASVGVFGSGAIVHVAIPMLLISLGVFIVVWGTVGQIIAATTPSTRRFASLASALSSRLVHNSEGLAR